MKLKNNKNFSKKVGGFTPQNFSKKNLGGFTLIEIIIYSAIFSVVLSMTIIIFYQILSGQSQIQNKSDIDAEASFLMQKIEWALNGAQSINQPVLGATSSVLSVSKYNFSQNPLVFDVASGTARLSRGGGSAAPLTDSRVSVDQFVFNHFATSGTEGVNIYFSLSQTLPGIVKASTTINNTIYLLK